MACRAAAAIAALALAVASCTGEETTPVGPASSAPGVTTPHQLEPTDQMRELAEQQCLDDPDLAEGVVNAVDPANEEQVLATVTVDCEEVRKGTG